MRKTELRHERERGARPCQCRRRCYIEKMPSVEQVAFEQIRPLRRVEYDQLVGLGVFEGERLELLRGRLVVMTPQKGPHASSVSRLNDLLVVRLAGRAQVRTQLPLSLTDDSEPEPDVAVVALGDYDEDHPHAALWVIEVSDASVKKDTELKSSIYAEGLVPEYWVVKSRSHITVRRDPKEPVRRRSRLRRGRDGLPASVLRSRDRGLQDPSTEN